MGFKIFGMVLDLQSFYGPMGGQKYFPPKEYLGFKKFFDPQCKLRIKRGVPSKT